MTDQLTIDTYNKSAGAFAKYFRGIGTREEDVQIAFKLAGNPNKPRILEIGCGDGRDAKEIIKYAGWYLGFDISEELIRLAKKHVPEASFLVADATHFDYPEDLDIVFAFASLLHLNKSEIQKVLDQVHKALKPGGVFYISLKHAPQYKEMLKQDKFGSRTFYFYNPDIITELAGKGYEVVRRTVFQHDTTTWLNIALKRI